KRKPPLKEPVRWLSSPIIFGPKNPPILAVQLMNPTAAAAAELVSSELGRAQNDGKYAVVPNPTRLNTIKSNAFECGKKNHAPNANAAVNCGIAKCHRRSCVRSELQPTSSIPIRPGTKGMAAIHPMRWMSVQPERRWSICGNQSQNA